MKSAACDKDRGKGRQSALPLQVLGHDYPTPICRVHRMASYSFLKVAQSLVMIARTHLVLLGDADVVAVV